MRLLTWLNKLKSTILSKEHMLEGIDLDAISASGDAQGALYDLLKETSGEKSRIKKEYEAAVVHMATLQRMEQLPKDAVQDLEKLAANYSDAIFHKDQVQRKLKGKGDNFSNMEKFKEDIPGAIEQMRSYEVKLQEIRSDMNHLEGEKAEILYKMQRDQQGLFYLRILMIGMVFIGAMAALVMTMMYFLNGMNVFLPAVVIVLVIGFIYLWSQVFRRYLIQDLVKNQKMRKREVEIHNKVKVKYVHVKQFLDFECSKYQVESSEMLALRWENYKRVTRSEEQLKRVNTGLATNVQDIDFILGKYRIEGSSYVLDHMDYFTSKKGRKMLQSALEMEKETLKESLMLKEKEEVFIKNMIESGIPLTRKRGKRR